jgi:Fic family protein
MKRGPTGRYLTVSPAGEEVVRAFVPDALPPPAPLQIGPELRDRLDTALLALGRLDSVSSVLPDRDLFLFMYVRKEAVLSSQIEGTQSSLSDLLLFEANEAPGVPLDDVIEVSSYVAALEHGLARVQGGFPISGRLIREIHERLLAKERGAENEPGEFRTSQNWIGGTRSGNAAYVPPPPNAVPDCMTSLERWIHDDPERTPTLIKAALGHVQFETIHPFLDGNGRVGRLLITLLLCAEGVLREPMLYLSLYLKQHRSEYYSLLHQVRVDGDWEAWLDFFARGVHETATGAVATARRLVELIAADRQRVEALGRIAGSALRVHRALQERPISGAAGIAERARLSIPTANSALAALEKVGVVRELTGRRRHRLFSYANYVGILSEGTEPLS